MAVWQFDVNAVCTTRGELLPAALAGQARTFLEVLRLDATSESETWTMYGSSDGNRIDVLVDGDGCEVSVRIDARSDAEGFVSMVCMLVLALDCSLYSHELDKVIPAEAAALKDALQCSAAWRYALVGSAGLG